MAESMGALVARMYGQHPTARAVVGTPGGTTSFVRLRRRVHQVANGLTALGVRPGDRVVIWTENRPEFLEVEQAAFLCGFVRVALSSRLHPAEVAHVIADCAPGVVVTDPVRAEQLRRHGMRGVPVVVVDGPGVGGPDYAELLALGGERPVRWPLPAASDLAALIYTSGTTGRPKGAMHTHRSWVAMVRGLQALLPPLGREDLVLQTAPMAHLGGSVGTACYVQGAATAMLPRFEADEVLRTVEELGVTVLPVVPTMLSALTAAAERGSFDLSSLRAVPYGGAAISPRLLGRAMAAFGEVLIQVYGLSEALVPLTALTTAEHRLDAGSPPPARLRSAGRPTPVTQVRVVGDSGAELDVAERGEIHVRGATLMAGYWSEPKQSEQVLGTDGWLHTGDLGHLDDDGYLYVAERLDDAIVSGGINIYPSEIERVIASLPEVDEVLVVGRPDEHWGEAVTAVVRLLPGASLTPDAVVDVCRRHLASYKKPSAVVFVDHLPHNSTGKLWRRQLRDDLRAGSLSALSPPAVG